MLTWTFRFARQLCRHPKEPYCANTARAIGADTCPSQLSDLVEGGRDFDVTSLATRCFSKIPPLPVVSEIAIDPGWEELEG